MLDLLRRGVKTWVAKVLFAVLVVSFAIWGIGDVFSSNLGSSVATVGDQKITAERFNNALRQEMRAQSQRFGQPIDADMARAIGLPQQVLSRMAQEATLDQAMEDLDVSASDANVRDVISSDPNFRAADGSFNADGYRYLLAQAGFTVEEYENATRRDIARRTLALALSAGGAAPDAAVETLYAFQTEERTIDFVLLEAGEHADDPGAPDEAALAAYHEENAETFTAPEKRTAVYLHLDLDEIAAEHEPAEAELRELYEQREAQYSLPERRALYQIVYDAEAEAQAAAERVASGAATFDDLLAERGETRDDAALGEPTAEEIPSAAGRAAFELEAEGLAGPVDTGFGFALVDVAAVTPAETTPFEDAREELAADLRREAALDRAPELAGEIEDLRAGGMTLEEIAEEVGLPLRTAASVSRRGDGAEGFAADPAFLAEIFAAEEGEERDMVETDLGEWFVLRLDGIEEPALRPLEDVRDLVAAGWRADALRASLLEKAEALEAELAAGKDIAAVAEELGVEARSEGPKTRLAGWTHLNEDMVEAVFGGDLGDAASGASPGRMDAVVVARVAAVADGPDNEENRRLREQLAAQMNGLAGEDALTLFMLAKQEEAGVSVNQQLIDSILVGGGGHGGM